MWFGAELCIVVCHQQKIFFKLAAHQMINRVLTGFKNMRDYRHEDNFKLFFFNPPNTHTLDDLYRTHDPKPAACWNNFITLIPQIRHLTDTHIFKCDVRTKTNMEDDQCRQLARLEFCTDKQKRRKWLWVKSWPGKESRIRLGKVGREQTPGRGCCQ